MVDFEKINKEYNNDSYIYRMRTGSNPTARKQINKTYKDKKDVLLKIVKKLDHRKLDSLLDYLQKEHNYTIM